VLHRRHGGAGRADRGAAQLLGYTLTGFAVLHTVTLGMKSRSLLLSMAYALVLVFGWPAIVMVILGLADAFFGIRQRYAQRRPPKPPPLPNP